MNGTYLGIDIGGTGIKGAPVDVGTGQLVGERYRQDTPDGAKPRDVLEVVQEVAAYHGTSGAVGITFPGVIVGGTILTAANMDDDWKGMDADTLFTEALGRPVVVLNDADAAGVAEVRFGAGRNEPGTVLMITIGTGLGSALFLDGRLLKNTELGHIEIDGKDAELLASGRVRDSENLSWKQYAKRLDKYLDRLDDLLWPDLFILGGGLSKEAASFVDRLTQRARVVPARLLNNAGIVGAAVVASEMDGAAE